MANYYTPSKRFSPLSFVYFLLASLIIIPIFGFIYSYAVWFIPFPYINFFITAGFGFLIGMTILYFVVDLGKVRNPMLSGVFGFLGALAGLYFSWAVWISLVMESPEVISSSLNLASQPGAMFEVISSLKEIGVWGFSDSTVSGTPLMIIWIIEALIVIVLGVLSPLGKSSDPFCEVNNKWFEEKQLPAFAYIATPQDAITALENQDVEFFKSLEKQPNAEIESHSAFVLYSNETNENFLSITNKLASLNDKGETEFSDTSLITHIEITEELSNLLEA